MSNSLKNPQERSGVARCLVVDDDAVTAKLITALLEEENYEVGRVGDGEEAIARCREAQFDVVTLDLRLPGMSGQEVCRQLREISDCYIVVVSVVDNEVDRVMTLALGADDYMTKPFSAPELRERVRAMMRRPRRQQRVIDLRDFVTKQLGDVTIDTSARVVSTAAGYIDLTELEFNILVALVDSSPRPVSRKVLIEQVWSRKWDPDDHVIDVHISNIRRKLRAAGVRGLRIQSVRAQGYRVLPSVLVQ